MASDHSDRRSNHWVKDLVIPLIIAVVVGISSAVVTVRVSVAVVTAEMAALKEDVFDIKTVVGVVQQNQLAINRLNLMAEDNHKEVLNIWTEVNDIKSDRYTKEDAKRDMMILRLENRLNESGGGENVQTREE